MPTARATEPPNRPARPATLLRTRVVAPDVPRQHVRRRRLIDTLRKGAELPLTLVDAPAGFGKTTLVADWCATDSGRRAFAWLSLDRSFDAPERFWRYVIASLAQAAPGLPLPHAARGPEVVDDVVALFADALAAGEAPVVLVLDDYHALGCREIHHDVAFMLDNAPPGLQLVILTRSDPPLPLGRLRANGELAELRAEDLRFTVAETDALLNDRIALGVDRTDVERLVDRTEGWAAGISLAAISLRGHPDPKRFVRDFAGTNRHVVDYLGSEVLDGQPDDVRDFLCRTSILGRLTGPLCDAVLGRRGSIEVLRRLERTNAFVVPLDADRTAYRYHQLFAELLRGELTTEDPAVVAGLHRRASLWYRGHGATAEAIDHAVAAGDVASVPELIAPALIELVETGRVSTVAGWLRALPAGAVAADPRLCLAAATAALEEGRSGDLAAWLARAEEGARAGPASGGPGSIEAWVATLRGMRATGDLGGQLEAAGRAVERSGDDRSWWGAMAVCALGVALYRAGRADEARQRLADAGRRGGPLTRAVARAHEALLALDGGDRVGGEHAARQALALVRDHGLDRYPRTGVAHLALGRSLAGRRATAAASAELEAAVALARGSSRREDLIEALTALAAVRRAEGLEQEARTLCLEARETLRGCPDPGGLAVLVAGAERESAEPVDQPARGTEEDALSGRELDVLRLLPSALTEPGIGAELFISHHTVHSHTRSIYRKLGVSSRGQAVQRARTLGLIGGDGRLPVA